MSKVLLVFVISPNLNPYINAMTHCVELHNVNKLVIVQLDELPTPPLIENFKNFIHEQMWRLIDDLATGIYQAHKPGTTEIQRIDLKISSGFDGYKHLRSVFSTRDHVIINYQHLRKEIIDLKRRYSDLEIMVDITGAPKRVAADILASCLAAGIQNIFTFELLIRSRDPVELLYHNLIQGDSKRFDHVLLPSSAPLVSNLALFSMNQNRFRLLFVVLSIFLALAFALGNLWFGGNNPWLTSGLIAISVFGGIVPIIDILLDFRLT